MLQLFICKSDTVKKGETPHIGAGKSTRAGHFTIPNLPVCLNCLHLAVQGTLTREKLNGAVIPVNPGHYGWMTPINCCADALTEILQLTEHSCRSNALLARRRAGMQQLCCWKGAWERNVTEGDSRNGGPYCKFCKNLVDILYLKCVPFLYFLLFEIHRR